MKMNKRFLGVKLTILVVAFCLTWIIPPAAYASGAGENPGKAKVLISFVQNPGRAEEALVESLGGTVKHKYSIIPSIAADLPEAAIQALSRNPRVKLIEPDIKAYAIGTYAEELNRTWGMVRIGEGTAHEQAWFGTGTQVAIIDSGIDYTNPELASAYRGGYDFVNEDEDPMDIDGHGTHVAGTIAAVRDGNGITGAAPAADLYALKVLQGGSGDFSDVIAALDWCVNHQIKVTNNSYGSSGDPGTQVHAAFDNAYASGVLHIAAAGNSGNISGIGDNVGYPAKYDSVVAVAASDANNKRAKFSSTGPAVELIAPGVNIYGTWIDSAYATASGTSMASPHVAGVAAQVAAADTLLSNSEIRDILRSTAQSLGLPANSQGYGLVRADLAVALALPVIPPATGTLAGIVRNNAGDPLAGAAIDVTS
ncbi:MAG: S8 family peptidase, partial [Syntrophomonadaceae bacterium]|nr:S8 family peptidase [Syntrophomonadaceae bacterium]